MLICTIHSINHYDPDERANQIAKAYGWALKDYIEDIEEV